MQESCQTWKNKNLVSPGLARILQTHRMIMILRIILKMLTRSVIDIENHSQNANPVGYWYWESFSKCPPRLILILIVILKMRIGTDIVILIIILKMPMRSMRSVAGSVGLNSNRVAGSVGRSMRSVDAVGRSVAGSVGLNSNQRPHPPSLPPPPKTLSILQVIFWNFKD